ncbi:hypothetical protein GJAV_G00053860 [Gymnothorax javanicus]|nr:hypothetical protein GJAV_G00053860 [Gymnothorax javanicus]
MALHQEKEVVLLNWINSLRLAEPVDSIFLLKDCNLLLKLICKLDGQEVQCLLDQPIQERLEFVSDFLQRRCRYKAERGSIVSWDNILNGENLDFELSKVVVLLMYHVIMNELLVKDKLDQETEFQMAALLRFVLDDENNLHLSDNLDEFLKHPFNGLHSGTTVSRFSDEDSPVSKRGRKSEVKFLELMTVASSSAGSPTQEVLSTPQLQLKKLREQLAEERDARDELERDLANSSQLVTEREMQISQLQSRLQRLIQDRAEQDQEPKELEELQNKNEGLLTRLHEVLKQCQELKTDKGQMEKKIDQLTEENGNMSVEIRDVVARLSSVQMVVDTLSKEQQASHAEWESKKKLLETELCQAVSERDSFSAQIQILQGKICVLEDELRDAQAQTREQGEVMGPIMEWERQNLEVSELTSKLSQLQETILQLEKEKGEMRTRHLMEKTRIESETPHLQGLVSELQEALCVLQGDKEALEQTSKEQQETMTVRISAMNAEIACLSEIIQQEKLEESELCSLRNEMQEKDNLHLQASAIYKAQCQELEDKISKLQVQVLEASSLASVREAELSSLHHKVKEVDNLRLQAAALEEAQRKELEEKVAHLQTQVLEASNLASERELELSSLQKEMKCKDSLKLKEGEMQAVQCRELEQKIMRLPDELERSSSLVIEKQQINAALKEELKERDRCLEGNEETIANLKTQILGASTQQENATKLQQQMVALRYANEELLSKREGLLKELEVSHKLTEDLSTQLKLAKEELSTLRPLKDIMAEISQLNTDLQEELSVKSEALEHYKAQAENAKIHYNGKKQQLQEANEKIKFITTDLQSGEQEVNTLKGQIEVLQVELDQARATEENLRLNVNSLQAQLDHADMQLQELKRHEKQEEMKPKESVHQLVAEKRQNSGDSLHLSLDDSLNSIRIPSERKESSTPVVRSSERLQAKRIARGGESLETLYFTPMNIRNAVDRKLESSINSLGELVLDSAKKSSSVRRRTTQVINITMTKKTPSSLETEFEDGSFYNLQSSQSFPNIASQKGRPFSLEFSEEATTMDQLRHLPGYRRSAAHSAVPRRSISTFRVGAENEPDQSEDWVRIAELQARNQAYLPHLKSCYPVESQPLLGKPALPVTDDELRTGDPNETIRRASLIQGQLKDSLASHRLSMSQIRDSSLSRRETLLLADKVARETLQPKRCPSNALNTRAATHSLKRRSCEPQSPDTPEAKKLASCFPRPMTPKDRNDRRFAAQNGQNRPPNTPVERRQSSRFSIENTPKKNGKHSLLQKGIDKMRASTRKSPGSSRKIPRSAKSPCPGKSPRGEKPQRRSPRINSSKSPKIASSTRKNVSVQFLECLSAQREEMAPEAEQ